MSANAVWRPRGRALPHPVGLLTKQADKFAHAASNTDFRHTHAVRKKSAEDCPGVQGCNVPSPKSPKWETGEMTKTLSEFGQS